MTLTPNQEFFLEIVLGPLLVFIGVVVGYFVSFYKTKSELPKILAEARKLEEESQKIRQERDALELKTDSDTIKHYIEIVNDLRKEALLQGSEIRELKQRAIRVETENQALRLENADLRRRIYDLENRTVKGDTNHE